MWIVPSRNASRQASDRAGRVRQRRGLGGALAAAAVMLAACTPPTFPSNTPTKEEVPFLGQQMTQEQIGQWLERVATERAQLQQTLSGQKEQCYQRFFVNTCLRQSQQAYQEKAAVLRKQEIELRRQERVLIEVDKRLRLKESGQ